MDLRNAVTLAGRLGADSDVITSTHTDAEIGKRSEARLVEFSLATNRSNPVEWHQFAAYADAHIKHLSQLKKGEKVQINRYIRNDRTKRDGVKVTDPKIVLTGFELMSMHPAEKSTTPATSSRSPTKCHEPTLTKPALTKLAPTKLAPTKLAPTKLAL